MPGGHAVAGRVVLKEDLGMLDLMPVHKRLKTRKNTPESTFGSNVAKVRTRFGLTQEDLAQRAGTRQSYISAVENGRKNPTEESMRRIASALGVSLHKLLKE